jgi:flagellar hook-basal body complex protein FliE
MDPLQNRNPLSSLPPVANLGGKPVSGGAGAADGANFGDILKQALQEVDVAQHTSEQEARNLMSGEATDMHTAILAVQKADVSFQMMMAVRSKLIDAYREVMRMQM